MIDVEHERLIEVAEVPNRLPRRRGKKIHYSTICRWIQRGCRGRRLDSVRVGGIRFTSWEALNRFFAEPHCEPPPKDSSNRQRAIAKAEAELDSEGISSRQTLDEGEEK